MVMYAEDFVEETSASFDLLILLRTFDPVFKEELSIKVTNARSPYKTKLPNVIVS